MLDIPEEYKSKPKEKYSRFHTRKYRNKHPHESQYQHRKKILSTRKRNENRKREVLQHYSPNLKCQRCGFSDLRALTIDHIYGGGSNHKRRSNINNLYLWLKRVRYPRDFQVLCLNCQWIKRDEDNELHRVGEPYVDPPKTGTVLTFGRGKLRVTKEAYL